MTTVERRAEAAERLRRFIGRRDGHEQALADVETLAQLPEVMGAGDVAEVLDTTTANLSRWRALPDPVYDLERGKLYSAEDIRELAAHRRAEAERRRAAREAA